MYSFFGGGNTLDYNTVTPSPEAISTICQYPLGKVRNDMGFQEYNRYKNDWTYFNHVWSYNYTVSTLWAAGTPTSYYAFPTSDAALSYSNGQASHVAYYSNVDPKQFANITH